MKPKPSFLAVENARAFKDPAVAEAYLHRPPYPPEIFDLLVELAGGSKGRCLELGCGIGEIARGLALHVDHVDAVDSSAAMLEVGRRLQGGGRPNLRWEHCEAEGFSYPADQYSLIVAAESLHWMNWEVLFPLLSRALSEGGRLAIIIMRVPLVPWSSKIEALVREHSTVPEFSDYNLIAELEERELFTTEVLKRTKRVWFEQTVDSYLKLWQSRCGFSPGRMVPASAGRFYDGLRECITPYSRNGMLRYKYVTYIAWGKPCPGGMSPG